MTRYSKQRQKTFYRFTYSYNLRFLTMDKEPRQKRKRASLQVRLENLLGKLFRMNKIFLSLRLILLALVSSGFGLFIVFISTVGARTCQRHWNADNLWRRGAMEVCSDRIGMKWTFDGGTAADVLKSCGRTLDCSHSNEYGHGLDLLNCWYDGKQILVDRGIVVLFVVLFC